MELNVKNSKRLKSFVTSQIYFLRLIFKEHPVSLFFFGLLVLLGSATTPLIILINKEALDKISNLQSNPELIKIIILLLFLHFLFNYLSVFFTEIENYIFGKITLTLNYILKGLISRKLVSFPLKAFEDSEFYDNIKLANIALGGSGLRVVENFIYLLGNIISLIGIWGVLTSIHWSMPIALFLSTLPGIILLFAVKIKSYRMERDISSIEREMEFTHGLFFDKKSLREIKIYKLGDYLLSKWRKLYFNTRDSKLGVAFWDLKTKSFSLFVLQSANLGVSLLLVYQINKNNLTIGSYVALLSAVLAVQGLFGSMGSNLSNIFEMAIYNNALLRILHYKEKNGNARDFDYSIDSLKSISVKNATFYYPNSNQKVLDNISLNIKRGDKISIVGSNGSGKTTLAYCILGLYDFMSGEYKVNDIPFEQINKDSFYSKSSAIFQDFVRFKFNIRENVGFGNVNKINNDEELFGALSKVDLESKVRNLDNDLETFLTKELPYGIELSGGEWQKVALSRAFLKDADFIVLDEPTAALDPASELEIFKTFHKLSKNKTTLTISHRIGPTKLSDLIIVMDKGRIVEQGSFDELLKRNGYFSKMYASQAIWYKNEQSSNLVEI